LELLGQFPIALGSPPILTHAECDGVGPSRMKSWCQPGGQTPPFGGAIIVHAFALQLNEGKIVRLPKVLPCVLEEALTRETRRFANEPDVMVIWIWPP